MKAVEKKGDSLRLLLVLSGALAASLQSKGREDEREWI